MAVACGSWVVVILMLPQIHVAVVVSAIVMVERETPRAATMIMGAPSRVADCLAQRVLTTESAGLGIRVQCTIGNRRSGAASYGSIDAMTRRHVKVYISST